MVSHAPDGRRWRCPSCGAARSGGNGRFYALVIAATLIVVTLIGTLGGTR